jgi:hypothetical protein
MTSGETNPICGQIATQTDDTSRCSLAYGTPPLINQAQHDVPVPMPEDLYDADASPACTAGAHCFVAFVTLTDVLGRCLDTVYDIRDRMTSEPEESPATLEHSLTNWEDSLSESMRRLVIRGTKLESPGAANLRLAYLSVKLLIRRSQLESDRLCLHIRDVDSTYYIQARRVCEEIVDFVCELDENHCQDCKYIHFFMLECSSSRSSSTWGNNVQSLLGARPVEMRAFSCQLRS